MTVGQRVALWRMRRERAAWERVTARMRRRDGSAVLQGEVWRWRELSPATWWLLLRWRPGRFLVLLRDDFRRWAVMPGDRFVALQRLVVGEVVAVKRDHVVMLVTPEDPGRAPHLERVDRDLARWWPA